MEGSAAGYKDKGNVAFKAGSMAEAAKLYAKAEKLDRSDPVYPSNLSAALYEMGDYLGSMNAILRSWRLLRSRSDSKPDLILRLSIRLAKALCNGFRSGAISQGVLEEHVTDTKDVEETALEQPSTSSNAAASEEVVRVWKDWRQMEPDIAGHDVAAHRSLSKFSHFSIYTKTMDPTLEFYSIGQDDVMSILEGWGPHDRYPLKLSDLSSDRLSNLAFFFGGVGDARHIHGSLIGLHHAFQKLNKPKRSKLHVHMTLLDIHPAMLARDLCIFMLVNELMECTDSTAQTEIRATLMYTFAGVVMPRYCLERLKHVVRDLRSRLSEAPPRLPPWIYVVKDSIPGILTILDYWALPINKTTTGILEAHDYVVPGESSAELLSAPGMGSTFKDMVTNKSEGQRAVISSFLNNMPDKELMNAPFLPRNVTAAEARKFVKDHHEKLVDVMMDGFEDQSKKLTGEQKWYKRTKVFFPPSELRKRHAGFDEAFRLAKAGSKQSQAAKKKLTNHIKNDWEVNITLFDNDFTENTAWCPTGYPSLDMDPFGPIEMFHLFNKRLQLDAKATQGENDARAFQTSSTFFGAVAEAIKALTRHITLEFLVGGITEELAKMTLKVDHTRPDSFPRLYTRMWLSNVQDYTHGVMNMTAFIVPSLRCEAESAAATNCLLNTGSWNGDEEFCYTYTLLTFADLPRFLGCKVICKEAVMAVLSLGSQPLPRPLSELASREELTTWLTRVLLYTVVPGKSKPAPYKIRLPHNLAAFVGLLIHLHRVGFPAHWLSEFLKGILSGGIATDLVPYRDFYPIPLADAHQRVSRRRLRLDPWLVELETLLATVQAGLPFPITLPTQATPLPPLEDIVLFEAEAEPPVIARPPWAYTSPFDPVINLLFFRGPASRAASLVSSIPAIFEGRADPAPGSMFVLTSLESVDWRATIRWRMSRARVERMRREEWYMIAYRVDIYEPSTGPVPISRWTCIGDGNDA
ncbi:hypothetical protein BKA93DRAFT_65275 [Sparassis latifolia]